MKKSAPTVEKVETVPPQRQYTYEELVAELPETNQPCELWDGELVMSPAPSFHHQEIVIRFSHRLYDWISKHDLGKVVTGPIDMVLSPHRVTQSDVVFISQDVLASLQRPLTDRSISQLKSFPWGVATGIASTNGTFMNNTA